VRANSPEIRERKKFAKAQLSFYEGDRANLVFRQPSPGTLNPRPTQNGVSASDLSISESNAPAQRDKRSALPHENDDPCPYYYDAILEQKMYRGPGFRQFHPVLGSMAGHKEICDEWDARQLERKNGGGQTRIPVRPISSIPDGESTLIDAASAQKSGTAFNGGQGFPRWDREQEQRCLEQVLVVFPQVQHDFVRKLFRERHPDSSVSLSESQAEDAHVPGAIIAEIAEMESIPKQKDLKRKHSHLARDNDDVTITWDKNVLKNETYIKEALKLLADEFTRVPTHFIHRMLREIGTLYDTFHFLAECENKYNNEPRKPYHRSKFGRVALEKKYQRTAVEQREGYQYVNIVNEAQAARQQRHREEIRQKRQKADEEAEAKNFAIHQLQGSLVDCQCCFDEAPINRAVNCENDETHFFCNRCINTRAKEQIGSLRHDMTCMDTSGCGAELSKEALTRALPVKISDKLAEIKQLAEIKAAGLDGLEQCPFCDYQAVCAPVDIDTLFECLSPNCEKVSCRKCKEESHVPRTCEEAKKDKGLSARHAVEEARSEAMMRPCPRCKVKIIKSTGCNKMTCSNCRAVMCYVCKKDITGRNYEHFGSGATACPLQDHIAEDRHQQEADEAEKAAITAAKAQDADVNEDDLRIEAHLNQRPGREREIAHHHALHRPPAGFPAPAIGQFAFFQNAQPQFLAGGEIADPRAGGHAVHFNRFNHLLDEAHQQHDRARGMLEEHQRHLQRLHPFIPATNAHPIAFIPATNARPIAGPHHGAIPPLLHAHHFPQGASPRPAADGPPAQPPWNLFNVGAANGLAAQVDEFVQRDMLQVFQRDFGVMNHNGPFQHNGDALPIQVRQNLLNDRVHYPMRAAQFNDAQNPRGNHFAQAQQQQQQAQGTVPNAPIGH
jgi:IBR domain, a half RING-finger domain